MFFIYLANEVARVQGASVAGDTNGGAELRVTV
jgi:hypothetical protein